ncbi:CRAL TRIO domain protein [Seminavis robusta]|uniref:CRAL TRIO domain protein n=1 Tax=Seminavis robusta TaxID=568900 RepID=A0A9N8HXE9_9STRA|nr:CRAL TRIO domain protein [Seminavis robusta]|eukprot:Sro2473_g328710.1 CRAL TRIO domain protein (343) ;mRNA; f:9725-11080
MSIDDEFHDAEEDFQDATGTAYPELTKEIVHEILESPIPYANDEEKETCQRMVEELSPEEQTTAACTSYAYWFAMTTLEEEPSEQDTLKMARREARRHLVASAHDEQAAMDRLRACLQFRKERRLDLLRVMYSTSPSSSNNSQQLTPEEEGLQIKYRANIEEELKLRQPFFVRGKDRDNRAVAVRMGRQSSETNQEGYITTMLYVAERAIAATEFHSRGTQEKVLGVMDFEGYSSSNAPPMWAIKESLSSLQNHYPERLKTAIITEPAFWMKATYNLLYPLMSEDTRDKVQMAYGEAKEETIRKLIAPEQAMPFMMPEAKLVSPFDADKFLNHVPFHCLYDD